MLINNYNKYPIFFYKKKKKILFHIYLKEKI